MVLSLLFKLPLQSVLLVTKLAKESTLLLLLLLVTDHFHLHSQVLRAEYERIFGRQYIPLHVRAAGTVRELGRVVRAVSEDTIVAANSGRQQLQQQLLSSTSLGGPAGALAMAMQAMEQQQQQQQQHGKGSQQGSSSQLTLHR